MFFFNISWSQTISIDKLIEVSNTFGYDSAATIIRPRVLYNIDTINSFLFAYDEFKDSYENRFDSKSRIENHRTFIDYPVGSIKLAKRACNDSLGFYLLEYYKYLEITNHHSSTDTILSIFGHGWFDDLLIALLNGMPIGLKDVLHSDLIHLSDTLQAIEYRYPSKLIRYLVSALKIKPELNEFYEDMNYRGLQIVLAISYLDTTRNYEPEIYQFRSSLPRYRRNYDFPIKPPTLKNNSFFETKQIELTHEFENISVVVENDSILIAEIFNGKDPTRVEGCFFQRPFVISNNSTLIWSRCHFQGFGNGVLYKLTLFERNKVIIEEIEMYL